MNGAPFGAPFLLAVSLSRSNGRLNHRALNEAVNLSFLHTGQSCAGMPADTSVFCGKPEAVWQDWQNGVATGFYRYFYI